MEKICAQLDQTVLNIFQVLEELYLKRDRLELVMKDGFLGISRTRYSLGVKRVSADQFVDAELMASRTVEVATNSGGHEPNGEDIFQLRQHDLKSSVTSKAKESVISSKSDPEPSGLRQRNISLAAQIKPKDEKTDSNARSSSGENNETQDAKKSEKQTVGKVEGFSKNITNSDDEDDKTRCVKNPLQLFGVLVPQHLRSSQKNFEEAVDLCVTIGNLKHKLDSLQSEFKTLSQQKEDLSAPEKGSEKEEKLDVTGNES